MLAPRSTRTTSRLVPSLLAVAAIVAAATVAGDGRDAGRRRPRRPGGVGHARRLAAVRARLRRTTGRPVRGHGDAARRRRPWSITVDVPAGSWEWKVALDGTWDRSYPARNVPLVLRGTTPG